MVNHLKIMCNEKAKLSLKEKRKLKKEKKKRNENFINYFLLFISGKIAFANIIEELTKLNNLTKKVRSQKKNLKSKRDII